MEKIFENKVAVVTGGSFGIGRAASIAFASKGAKVVIVDWMEDDETLDLIKAMGGTAIFVKCDVSINEDVKAMVERTIDTYGQLDFAFNNVGMEGIFSPTNELAEEAWDRTIGDNLRGVWFCMKHEIIQMLKQGNGAIVNNASVAGLVGFKDFPAYIASKHGVIGLSRTAAMDYAELGIRINAVCPGIMKTSILDHFTGKKKEVENDFDVIEAMEQMDQHEEVAEAAIWLCSDSASFVTGLAMSVDGGWVAQ